MRRSRRNGQCRRTSPGAGGRRSTISISSSVRPASARIVPNGSATKLPPQNSMPSPSPGRLLVPDAVDRRDVDAVGDRVRALHRLPRRRLRRAVLRLLGGVPADRRRVEEHVRARQRRQPRRLRVPLVPADQRADAAERAVERAEAEVAGREVELLVVERVVRDVHLAVDAQQLAVGVDDHRRVVIDAGRAPLEERPDDDDARLLRAAPASASVRRARDRLGQVEVRVVLALAEVLRAEQLGQADDVGAALARVGDARDRAVQIVVRVGRATHLHEPELELLWRRHVVHYCMIETMLPSSRSQIGIAAAW